MFILVLFKFSTRSARQSLSSVVGRRSSSIVAVHPTSSSSSSGFFPPRIAGKKSTPRRFVFHFQDRRGECDRIGQLENWKILESGRVAFVVVVERTLAGTRERDAERAAEGR
jgi:hypothetical protein